LLKTEPGIKFESNKFSAKYIDVKMASGKGEWYKK